MRACGAGVLLAMCLAVQGCSEGPWGEVKAFPDIFSLNDLWVFGPDKVWAVGSGGAVVRYDGSDWTTEDTGSWAELTGIWAFAPDDVWVVGGEELLHWDGSGWESTDLDAQGIRNATGIWGMSPAELWILHSAHSEGGSSEFVISKSPAIATG